MKKFTEMTIAELNEYINGTYDASVELIKKTGYWKYYKALGYDYDTATVAFEIAEAIHNHINEEHPCDAVIDHFNDLWDEIGMEMSGMDEDEYEENADDPIWERDDWKWNEETEEWETVD